MLGGGKRRASVRESSGRKGPGARMRLPEKWPLVAFSSGNICMTAAGNSSRRSPRACARCCTPRTWCRSRVLDQPANAHASLPRPARCSRAESQPCSLGRPQRSRQTTWPLASTGAYTAAAILWGHTAQCTSRSGSLRRQRCGAAQWHEGRQACSAPWATSAGIPGRVGCAKQLPAREAAGYHAVTVSRMANAALRADRTTVMACLRHRTQATLGTVLRAALTR